METETEGSRRQSSTTRETRSKEEWNTDGFAFFQTHRVHHSRWLKKEVELSFPAKILYIEAGKEGKSERAHSETKQGPTERIYSTGLPESGVR